MHSLKGKKIALFVESTFEDLELFYPKIRLTEAGAEVKVIGPKKQEYEGKNGLTIEPDALIDEVSADDFDALVVPGGYSPDHMRRNKKMVQFVKQIHAQNKPIAAICHAPWLLAEADILKGVTLTSFASVSTDLKNAGRRVGGQGGRREQEHHHEPRSRRSARLLQSDHRAALRGEVAARERAHTKRAARRGAATLTGSPRPGARLVCSSL